MNATGRERTLGLDRAVHLVLDRSVEIEAFVRAPAAVEECVATGGDRLGAPRFDHRFGKRPDLTRHDAQAVGLERQPVRERALAAGIEEHLERAAPGLVVPARAVELGT